MISAKTQFFYGAIIIAFLTGCGGYKEPSALPRGWDILERDPGNAVPVSRKVLLLADNQLHYLYGKPFLHRSVFADKYFSGVAIRSPQLDLFGQDLLRWALNSSQKMPVIHLGDALDLACGDEFAEFVAIMKAADRPWVMAPGNHDSFFFGNFDDIDHFWQQACHGGAGPLRKDMFVARYLDALGEQWPSLREHVRANRTRGEWRCDPAREGSCFVQAIRWQIDADARWQSYVLQKVDLSRVAAKEQISAILLDATQYPDSPHTIFLHAGTAGSILANQADAAREWLDSAAATGEKVVLATHHPYPSLSEPTQRYVDEFMTRYPVLLLLSAHTHAGRYDTHGSGDDAWLELNIGSILDWPVEYRTLAFRQPYIDGKPDHRNIILASELIRLPMQWREDFDIDVPACEPGWEAKPTAAMPGAYTDFYLDYRSLADLDYVATKRAIYNNLLAAYERMFRCLPIKTAASAQPAAMCETPSEVHHRIQLALEASSLERKREELLWLRAYERNRPYADPAKRDHYRLCQARWASWYEDRRARVPQVDDEYIAVPWSPKKRSKP